MSKKQQTKSIANRNGVAIEQQTIVDDNLLPTAEELQKLQQVDSHIVTWIMQRAEREQETRLSFNRENMRLAHRKVSITQMSLLLAFVLAVIVLLLSGVFIYMEKELAASVFGGVGVVIIIQSFLKFGKK